MLPLKSGTLAKIFREFLQVHVSLYLHIKQAQAIDIADSRKKNNLLKRILNEIAKAPKDSNVSDKLKLSNLNVYYHPQLLLRKGNIFTSVCKEFCPRWVSTPLYAGTHTPSLDTHTPRQILHWADTPSLPPRWPLQRTVHILLECILVLQTT